MSRRKQEIKQAAQDGELHNYIRVGRYVWPYRRMFLLSVGCAVAISLFWALNLSIAFPMVKVLFENDSISDYVLTEIADQEAAIAREESYLATLDEDQVSNRARSQRRLHNAGSSLVTLTMVRDHVLPWVPDDKFDTIVLILGVLLCATVLKGVFIYCQELLVGSVVQLTVNSIRQDCFRNILRLDFQSLNRLGPSSVMSRLTSDIDQVAHALRIFCVTLVREPLKAVACTMAAFALNWRLTLLAVTVVPLLGLVFARFGKLLRDASHRTMESMASIYGTIRETLDGLKVVLAFSGQRRHRRHFLKANRDFYQKSMRVVRIGSLVRPITEVMGVIAVFAALFPGAYLVLRQTDEMWGIQLSNGPMQMAELTTLYALLAGTLDPVRKLSSVFSQIKRGMAGGERVFELLDCESSVPEPVTARKFVRHSRSISFKNISFRYDNTEETGQRAAALTHIDLEIPFGEVVAVVGGNGSGKSTLISMLPRFIDPADGQVLIDGVDIREYRTHDLRSQLGLVSQETMLFDDTIYENIRYGNPDADFEDIEEAARAAHALSFISQFPDGFETRIGEKGGRLSGGQRQRIALARAIARNPSILILDEATSAVDSTSEEVIHRVLKEFARDRTVFMISHVLNRGFLDLVDRVVLMDQGRLRDIGTHDELLARSPMYRGLCQFNEEHRDAA